MSVFSVIFDRIFEPPPIPHPPSPSRFLRGLVAGSGDCKEKGNLMLTPQTTARRGRARHGQTSLDLRDGKMGCEILQSSLFLLFLAVRPPPVSLAPAQRACILGRICTVHQHPYGTHPKGGPVRELFAWLDRFGREWRDGEADSSSKASIPPPY